MSSFFSCFSCGDSKNTISPQPVPLQPAPSEIQQSRVSLAQQFEDNKSKSATTMTFRTTDTAPSSAEDEESYIRKKIEQIRKKDLPERKAMQSQFIRQNLSKSSSVFLVQKQWSELYTNFLKNIEQPQLRSINNSRLVDSKNNLRSDVKEKQDYFIINDRVWKFVQQMYGGGPTIIQDMFFPVISLSNRKVELPALGIANPLNLCFMIAVTQCLLSNQHLAWYLLKQQFQDNKKKTQLHSISSKLVKAFNENTSNKAQFKQLAAYMEQKFNPFQQHDAHQYFLYLANQLQQQINQQTKLKNESFKDPQTAYSAYFKVNRSIIDRLYVGQMETVVECMRCSTKSSTYNPFIDITLEIADSSLEGCLKKHFQIEKIDEYECQKCQKKTRAKKQYFVSKTPNYMIITLKKFQVNGKKIQDRVKYPLNINLRTICRGHSGDERYTLQSVLVHKGTRSTKGHYYCYTSRMKKGLKSWYYMNDDVVKEIEGQEAMDRDGYILFYERAK